jgi:hypothetical protein
MKHGAEAYPQVRQFIVLAVGRGSNLLTDVHRAHGGARVMMRETTWDQLAGLKANPFAEEFRAQLAWRTKYSKE